ncbi:IS630 family transposase [Streptomyces sp. NPDC056308]
MQAAELFEQRIKPPEAARRLRVSLKSAYQWHQRWREGGVQALASRGPSGSRCRLSARCLEKLAVYLQQGPAAHGWVEDQVWTAARVTTLIGRKFHVSYSVSGATRLMHRLGFSPQVPARRVAERDEQAVTVWKEATWAEVKERGRPAGGYICFEDEAGFTRRPPRGRTWGRRGRTPVVTVSGRRSGRLSVAGLIAMRPGSRTRLCHRLRTHPSGVSYLCSCNRLSALSCIASVRMAESIHPCDLGRCDTNVNDHASDLRCGRLTARYCNSTGKYYVLEVM